MVVPVDIAAWDLRLMADLCGALQARNERILAEGRYPLLFDAGVMYRLDPPSEPLFDLQRVLARGGGDCEDLAAWRAAELRVFGWAAVHLGDAESDQPIDITTARVVFLDFGHLQYHAVVGVDRHDGTTFLSDPSARLGMRGPVDPIIRQRCLARGAA